MGEKFSLLFQKWMNKKTLFALAVITASAGFFFLSQEMASAGIIDAAAKPFVWAFGYIIQFFVGVLGQLLITLFYILIAVANYNQFLASTAVNTGWIVVRDVMNMFFVVVLLVIAIGTILQQQKYSYSQMLPKFLIAAIFINFSKTICGLMIDASQIVMMTFVGAISGAVGGNLAALIGIPMLLKQVNPLGSDPTVGTVDSLTAMGGFALALILVTIALIVVGVMVVMLVIRIVALWFLIVLSPVAFFLPALPNDKGMAAKWWDQFINNLLVGPVMMFFLWLSLSVVAAQNAGSDATNVRIATELGINLAGVNPLTTVALGGSLGSTGISSIGGLSGYILGICMLMGSLMAAQQLSSAGGSVAGSAAGYIKDWGAGKKGPSPMRYIRESVGGVMARREERRKENVKGRVERFDRAVGIAQQVPANLVKAGAKWATADTGVVGQTVRRGRQMYQSEGVQTGLDKFVQVISAGTGGWGMKYKARVAEYRSQQEKTISSGEAEAGIHRGDAQVAEGNAMDMEVSANEAQRAGNTGQAQMMRNSAALERQRAVDSKQAAEAAENQVNGAKFNLARDTVREKAFSVYGKAARLLATGVAGSLTGGAAWGAGAVMSPKFWGDMEKSGAESVVLAETAQASSVSGSQKKLEGDNLDEINGKLGGTILGWNNTNTQHMGLLMAKMEKGGFGEDEVEGVRREMKGSGADHATMKQFEALVFKKHPTQAFAVLDEIEKNKVATRSAANPDGIADSKTLRALVASGGIKGEDINKKKIEGNREAATIIFDELAVKGEKATTDFFAGMKTDEDRASARDHLKVTIDGELTNNAAIAARPATTPVDIAQKAKDLAASHAVFNEKSRSFLLAGGKLEDILPDINAASGDIANPDQARVYDQMMADPNVAHIAALTLPEAVYDNEANYSKPLLQGVARATAHDSALEKMKAFHAVGTKTQKQRGGRSFNFIGKYGKSDQYRSVAGIQKEREKITQSITDLNDKIADLATEVTARETARDTSGHAPGSLEYAAYEQEVIKGQQVVRDADAQLKRVQKKETDLLAAIASRPASPHAVINENDAERASHWAPRL